MPEEKKTYRERKIKGLYKRGKIWWITYTGPDSIRRFESTKTISKDEAEYILACRRKEIKEGIIPELIRIKKYTFSELAHEYIKWAERQKGYQQKKNLIKHLINKFGHYPLMFFSTKMLEHYQTEKLQNNKPATVNRHTSTLKHMFTKAVDWEMVNKDVREKIRKVKQLPENNKRLRFLTKDECNALITACGPHLKPIVITALTTGMRKGEILKLKWDQVDLTHGFILLEDTKNRKRREIPISQGLRETFLGLLRRIDSPWVFYDMKTGKPYQDVKTSFQTALRRTRIRDFRFHDLRHTFASHLVMAGVDIITVKELLGHMSLDMTLRYAHLAPSHKVKAMETLERQLMLGPKIRIERPMLQ